MFSALNIIKNLISYKFFNTFLTSNSRYILRYYFADIHFGNNTQANTPPNFTKENVCKDTQVIHRPVANKAVYFIACLNVKTKSFLPLNKR